METRSTYRSFCEGLKWYDEIVMTGLELQQLLVACICQRPCANCKENDVRSTEIQPRFPPCPLAAQASTLSKKCNFLFLHSTLWLTNSVLHWTDRTLMAGQRTSELFHATWLCMLVGGSVPLQLQALLLWEAILPGRNSLEGGQTQFWQMS